LSDHTKKQPKKKKIWTILLFAAILGCIAALCVLCVHLYEQYTAGQPYIEPPVTEPQDEDTNFFPEAVKPHGVDFEALWAINPDLCAYIIIPNTKVEYPIAYEAIQNDNFYLTHNIYRDYEFAGCIFMQDLNRMDFSDPNTILYGHNMRNGTMFGDLRLFREPDFFDDNAYIYIYTPGHKLTYHIFAAYDYDNRNIMLAFDFTDKAVFQEYLDYAVNPTKASGVLTRPLEVTADDKIVTLSTCFHDIKTKRFLVQGVLINDEPTQ